MIRAAHFVLLFVACFLGVLSALWVHDRLQPKATGLDSLISKGPVKTSKVAGQVAFSEAAEKLRPSVVSVITYEYSMFRFDRGPAEAGQGSGVIIASDGYIVTNFHVVQGADKIAVRMLDGKTYDAEFVGGDQPTDLALLKIAAKNLPSAELADSSEIEVGEWVIAVGNPLGFENTVSVGVVSALDRDLIGGGNFPLVDAIQTDAAINRGNSGGALGNVQGQVIGINTQIATEVAGSIGLGFAIPSNRVLKFVSEIRKYGRMRHPNLGIESFVPNWQFARQQVEEQIGPNPPEGGLMIRGTIPGTPIEKAGIGKYDILMELDGKQIDTVDDYLAYLLKVEIGHKAQIKYWQRGEVKTATVVLEEMPR
ncbi:trypsin-like serine protease [Fimbriimonadia bacterium ATM]|nr:MAG: PDZ domain-containing protein [Armatimonadota bacterium]MBC6970201.1 PDZ domain-containing protein [Armatimonadota bacterium]MCE7900604.1 PDZ domain-containing protein [Armatimonadetes bacterium ATM1]MDL1929377.1 trypsin-like serine protease [Fimbriimonadia bacterium ATM]RIJ97150.1 MAG: HtrA2 peptidase [Armatimonadota bacterium]